LSYHTDEISVDSGQPIELYLFTYDGVNYAYTSSTYSQSQHGFIFNPEIISRGSSLKLGDSGGTVETCVITVPRNNSIAMLYQGAPPELDSVRVQVFRVHGEMQNNDFIKILDGVVSQVRFSGSFAELTITIENVLNRYIPRGTISYHCQNCIYDSKCRLDKAAHAYTYYVDNIEGLTIHASDLKLQPTDFFTDGFLQMGNSVRAIVKHEGESVRIKYPINKSQQGATFIAYPGCSGLFSNCAKRFGNTDNFNGIPYIQPYNAFKHPVDTGAYWIDNVVIKRDTFGYIGQMSL